MRTHFLGVLAASFLITPALAQTKPTVDPARVEQAVKDGWRNAPPEWQARLMPDETMKQCSASENSPPQAVFEEIQKREKATDTVSRRWEIRRGLAEGREARAVRLWSSLHRLPAAQSEWRQLLRVSPVNDEGGQLRHHRTELAWIRQAPRIHAGGHKSGLR